MTEADIIERYQESAKRNLITSKDLYDDKHYDWALFLGQLAIEKLLKALVIKQSNTSPPHIHDLAKLAQLANLELSQAQKDWLIEITRYHIQARYDDIKYELYKTATPEYTSQWIKRIEEVYQWIQTHF